LEGSEKGSNFASFFGEASFVTTGDVEMYDPSAGMRRKTVLVKIKRKDKIMKKVLFSLLTSVALIAGVTVTNAAMNTDNFTVRFRENTLIVASTQMEEARIYSMQGKLLQKEQGRFVEFPLERGTYRLYAKVNGETVTRRIELR